MNALNRATAALEPPFAVMDLDAFDANAADLLRRAGGKPVRLASKSVRCRALQRARAGRRACGARLPSRCPRRCGWPGHGYDDLVVAYPTVDRAALRELAAGRARARHGHGRLRRASRAVVRRRARGRRGAVRVCLDVDAGWWPLRRAAADRRAALAAAHARAGGGAGPRDRRAAGARARRPDEPTRRTSPASATARPGGR